METARNEALAEGVATNPATADESAQAVSQNIQSQAQQTQRAQAEPPPASPESESGRAAAAASTQPEGDAERGSVLQQFLADGPPQLEEGRDEAPAGRRPVEMGQQDAESGPAEPGGGEEPLETATDEAPVSGGVSVYRDFDSPDLGDLAPDLSPTPLPSELADGTAEPEGADPIIGDPLGEALALSSLAASAPIQDVAVPPAAPPPTEPESELDPLTSRRLAAGEDPDGGGAPAPNGDPDDQNPDDQNIVGTADDDTLDGGAGDDTLTGGDGADVFAFSTVDDDGNDVVTDFEAGTDRLRLSDVIDVDADGPDLGDLEADAGNSVTGDAAGVTIGLAGGTTVTLTGVDGTGVDSFAELSGSGVNVDVA